MLIEGQQLSQRPAIQAPEQEGVGGPATRMGPVRRQRRVPLELLHVYPAHQGP
ncbi:MAG: hypothetical protein U5L11_05105 [Arhodomonas sp.]|nr:hypothetical protein [Arhodomonas sp.]